MIETTLRLSNTKEARRDKKNPYEMHRTLERIFAGTPGRILWRLDGDELTIRAESFWYPPHIVAQFPEGYTESFCAVADDSISSGTYSFRLLANPVCQKSKTRQVCNLTGSINQVLWLARKGAENGFLLHDCRTLRSYSYMSDNPKNITIVATEFRGMLEVTDAEKFERCLIRGIGRGKAFGLGLLKLGQHAVEAHS